MIPFTSGRAGALDTAKSSAPKGFTRDEQWQGRKRFMRMVMAARWFDAPQQDIGSSFFCAP